MITLRYYNIDLFSLSFMFKLWQLFSSTTGLRISMTLQKSEKSTLLYFCAIYRFPATLVDLYCNTLISFLLKCLNSRTRKVTTERDPWNLLLLQTACSFWEIILLDLPSNPTNPFWLTAGMRMWDDVEGVVLTTTWDQAQACQGSDMAVGYLCHFLPSSPTLAAEAEHRRCWIEGGKLHWVSTKIPPKGW